MSRRVTGPSLRCVPVVEITTLPPHRKRRRSNGQLNAAGNVPPETKRGRQSHSADPIDTISPQMQSSRATEASAPPKSKRGLLVDSPTVSEFGLFGSDLVGSTSSTEPNIPPSSRPLSSSPHAAFQDEDFTEELNLVLNDEGINMNESADSGDEDDVPVRVLQYFTIYDSQSLEPLHISELLQVEDSSKTFSASGAAMALYINEDDSDDGSPPPPAQLVRLSDILEFSLHYYDADNNALDSKLYIRTEYAWYILDEPSKEYRPYFDSFAIQHHALHLLLDYGLRDAGSTLEGFIQSLSKRPKIPTLGRRLKRTEFESSEIRGYIIYYLPRLDKKLQHLPLVKELVQSIGLSLSDVLGAGPRSKKERSAPKVGRLSERDVLKHRNHTVVTPMVSRIAQNLFRAQLEVAGALAEEDVADQRLVDNLQDVKKHHSDPKNVRWGDHLIPDSNLKYYDSLIMDGVKYEIGDVVMVNPGKDENATRARNATSDASHSRNTYANRVWFCRICYFYEKKGQKFFHGQWFLHGSKTLLQETAHSRSLYLLMECEDNLVASIFQKCNITMLTPGDAEKVDDGNPEADDFHCGLVWDQESSTFHDLPTAEEAVEALECLPGNEPCFACYFKLKQSQQEGLQTIRHGLMWNGVPYHKRDFVYLNPADLKHDGVYEIAQIVAIKEDPEAPVILVRMCGRYRGLHKKRRARNADDTIAYHDRRLYFEPRVTSVPVDRFDGKCFVKHLTRARDIEEWVEQPDHFYLYEISEDDGVLYDIDASDFEVCKGCMDDELKKIDRAADFKRSTQPLRGLELFSGAGGLGTGLELSGYVDTKYAVEFSPSAATTYQHNHPETIVYCQDSNVLLKHAIDAHEGKQPPALKSNDGKTLCPPMPPKDKVDFIYGGPPCQSFSGANHNRKADDIRSTLPGNMLSYLEFYEADYFMLENVKGLLSYPLMSEQDGLCLEGGIKAGVVKLVMRVLIALGYQVTVKLLQAGHYGAPQGRLRVIFFGAKRGLKLPEFPVPEYAFPGGAHFVNLPTGERLSPATRSRVPGDYHQCAPLPPITINQSIGDLPAFDWINPHEVFKRKPRDVNEVAIRAQEGIIAFDAVLESGSRAAVSGNGRQAMKSLVGFPDPVPYMLPPQNMYQKWMRQTTEELVDDQYTKRFGAAVVEATATLPFRPNATHRDLPINLRPRMARPGGKQENKVFYGRPDGDGHFKTALTSLTPQLKGVWPIHPTQKRIFTVRECARAQGFPDHYSFQSADANPQKAVDNQIRQIGNAVPVPLALALGKSLGAALLENWEARKREWSPDV